MEFWSAGGIALVLNPGKDERPKKVVAKMKHKESHKSLHLIRPSLSVSLGCPTQKVKKDPSELTLRVHTPIGYQPTWEVAMINDPNFQGIIAILPHLVEHHPNSVNFVLAYLH